MWFENMLQANHIHEIIMVCYDELHLSQYKEMNWDKPMDNLNIIANME
jgi:hypothetical protein